jgi:hypothetical protein
VRAGWWGALVSSLRATLVPSAIRDPSLTSVRTSGSERRPAAVPRRTRCTKVVRTLGNSRPRLGWRRTERRMSVALDHLGRGKAALPAVGRRATNPDGDRLRSIDRAAA